MSNSECDSHANISGGTVTYSTIPVPGLDATTVATKIGDDFPFKGFISGTGILVDETTNPGAITITATGAAQSYTYSTEVVPGVTSTVVGTQIGSNFGFRPIAGLGDVTVDNTTVPGALAIQSNVTFSTNPVLGLDATVVDTKVGSDLRFRGFIAGPNVVIDQVSQPGAIVISASGGSPAGQLLQNNTVFVDSQFGNDVAGLRERRDLPFQTIGAAITASLPGDQIHIFPGVYNETNNVPTPLYIHAEEGVSLTAAGANIFNITGTNRFSLTGEADIVIGSGKTGFVISSPVQVPIIKSKTFSISGGVGFSVSGGFGQNLNIDAGDLAISSGTFVSVNSPAAPALAVAASAEQTLMSGGGYIFNGSGSINSFMFNSERIDSTAAGEIVRFSGSSARILLKGKTFESRGIGGVGGYFFIEDTVAAAVKSNVFFSFDYDHILVPSNSPILTIQSFRPTLIDGNNPIAEIVSKQAYYRRSGFNANMFTANMGDIIIRSHDLEIDLENNNVGFDITGSLTIDCSGTFRQTSPENIVRMLDADNFYIRAFDMYLQGPIISSNGHISADTLVASSGFSLTGNVTVNARISSFSNTKAPPSSDTGIVILPGTTADISGDEVIFTSTTSGPVISSLAPPQPINVKIKSQSLVFNNSGGSSSMIVCSNSSVISIDSDYIENVSISLTNSVASMNCERYLWTPSGGSNIALRGFSNSVFNITGGMFSLTGIAGFASFSNSAVNMSASNFNVLSTGTMFNLLGSPASATVLNIKVGSISLTSPSPGTILFSNTQGAIIADISDISSFNSNVSNIFLNTAAATIRARIGTADIPCRLLESPTGSNILHCDKCRTSSSNPLVSLGGVGSDISEISGNFTTLSGANAVVITGSPTVTIGPSKLYSVNNSILGPGSLTINVVPSIASVAATGVTIVGSLLISGSVFP